MIKLDGIETFVTIAEAGSISETARRLALSKSVVSERLAELERTLGTRLIQRTTRKLSLTEDGLAFLERARRIFREAIDATAEMAERRGTLAGPLRIAGPVSFGTLHLGPALYPFLAANPGIDLTLDLDDRFVDVAADGYDAVVRHGPIRENRLVVRKLAPSRRLLVASSAYLDMHGTPASLAELEAHRAIFFANRDVDWRFVGPDRSTVARPRARLRVNNGMVMRGAVLAGLGIALLPSFLIGDEIAQGSLRVIDLGIEAEGAEIHVACPKDRATSAKVLALTQALRHAFGNPPYWERGLRQASATGEARVPTPR